ncbi:hypothetical protein [Paenibacillus marchantiophytorum]|uniref:hypothetical protein n=1 Tax=Paenibacillus marchantiophytorum TaxID=1619310 RepID=UPI001665D19B|nr:hypothetical protein [Paenibacillus marchantiophytorum]
MIDMTEGILSSADTKTHQRYMFPVSEHCKILTFNLDYSPSFLEDEELSWEIIRQGQAKYEENIELLAEDSWKKYVPLKNLITVSLDDPVEFRGACHRKKDSQRLFISAGEASPGLMPGHLIAGQWTITLSFHAIVTDRCEFKLEVWEEESDL